MISDFGFYIKLLSRRFPAMAALFMLCSCIGLVMALRLPTTYSTSATLLVEPAQIRDGASVQIDTSEQLEVIQQRLMTRANLLQVARDNRVFPNQSAMNPDEVVEEMRKRTGIRRTSGRNRATLMTISFEGGDPRQLAAVVNQYVTIVLNVNSDFRKGIAEGTLEFFEQEVDTLSQNLDRQSAEIVAFKNENADALPENLDYRLGRQSLLQERLARAERDLEGLKSQQASIQHIYETTGSVATDRKAPLTPEQKRLRDLEGQLRVALTIYSDTNPKIRLLRNQIDMLTTQMQPGSGTGEEDEEAANPQLSALDASLAEIGSRIKTLETEIETASLELEKLQDSIDRTPANRIALDALQRDQSNTQSLYSAAVKRLSEARMGERIELSSKGERITVLEPPSVPNKPSGPNRFKVIGMGVAMGLAMAGGLFVLLELLNQTMRRPSDILRALDITPLASIPRFETAVERHRRRILQLTILGVVLVSVPAALWAVDTYYMPLDLLFEKVISRLT